MVKGFVGLLFAPLSNGLSIMAALICGQVYDRSVHIFYYGMCLCFRGTVHHNTDVYKRQILD